MAFPTSPTNGQIYKNYIYNSTSLSWKNQNADTLDGIQPGARGLTALAQATSLDADMVSGYGIGVAAPVSMVTSLDNYKTTGIFVDPTGSLTNSPFSDGANGGATVLVQSFSANYVSQMAVQASYTAGAGIYVCAGKRMTRGLAGTTYGHQSPTATAGNHLKQNITLLALQHPDIVCL